VAPTQRDQFAATQSGVGRNADELASLVDRSRRNAGCGDRAQEILDLARGHLAHRLVAKRGHGDPT